MDLSNNLTKSKELRKFVIPSIDEPHLLVNHKYTMQNLKIIAKSFSLKMSGNKTELTSRIHHYMFSYKYATRIQRAYRRKLSNLPIEI